jgi:hypothetical protein
MNSSRRSVSNGEKNKFNKIVAWRLCVAGFECLFVVRDGNGIVLFLQVVKDVIPDPDHDVTAQLTDVMDQLRVELAPVPFFVFLGVEAVLVVDVSEEAAVELRLVVADVAGELTLILML